MPSSSQERLLRWLCRIYGLMLMAYPSTFRRDYSREMTVVFRTRARDVLQNEGGRALLPFMVHVTWDWLQATLKERTDMAASMPTLRWYAALPTAILTPYAVLRTIGLMIRFVGPHDLRPVTMWLNVGWFLAAATFVSVGAWVVPSRKDSVARIALAVVAFWGALCMAWGALSMATTLLVWGACILLGGIVAYVPWRLRALSQA